MEKSGKSLAMVIGNNGFDFVGEFISRDSDAVTLEHPLNIQYGAGGTPNLAAGYYPAGFLNVIQTDSQMMIIPMRNVAYVSLLPMDGNHEICRQYESFFEHGADYGV